ncbi:MAG: DUF721 domain-containing protein [Propionibacteriaceae bacterium]
MSTDDPADRPGERNGRDLQDVDRAAGWSDPVPAGLTGGDDPAWVVEQVDPDGADAEPVQQIGSEVDLPPAGSAQPTGGGLAQQALAAARAQPGRPVRRRRARRDRLMSGSGADDHDPAPLGALVDRLVTDRGWERSLADAGVFGRWAELVGPDIAAHCRPERLTAGELVVAAESTAWATQLRLLAPMMLARLAERLGAGVVTGLQVQGPTQPGWVRGRRRVRGRGPRDTYG